MKAGVPQGSILSPLIFLVDINGMTDSKHHQNSKSQFVDDTGLWVKSKKEILAAQQYRRKDSNTGPTIQV